MNSGTVIWYQNHQGDERTLNEKDAEQENTNSTTAIESQSNITVAVQIENPPFVSFKKGNLTESDASDKKIRRKKKKTKKKKNRVNREILTTLLSRKKFYKIFEHKLDMLVN